MSDDASKSEEEKQLTRRYIAWYIQTTVRGTIGIHEQEGPKWDDYTKNTVRLAD
jgi:hypothetical protein